ncbi:D-alanyl-D-alanine carboxypeptidase family protein [Roseburia sp. 499]|uniref:D-alanyl-D-alanine carboxypeptidase family protein n=1 Tax=Roseburia sp. 499 TaxID=1261634 RepID=UPI001FA8A433|nr:serine hydrolase [Roseburia sp. 499]WVK71412.1 serine hydrolase [Roseburia sp. 499]
MRCINKKRMTSAVSMILTASFLLSGCGKQEVLEDAYNVYDTTSAYGMDASVQEQNVSYFADNLCVTGTDNILTEGVTENLSEAAGLFDTVNHEVKFAKNIYERRYPASTTKILTAYVALKYGDLAATATVTEEELQLESGSTTCGLSVGDTISLQELLYGLILCSGNDAANVIADMISGSTEEFANLMTQEAYALGATNSHFVNPHGLHNEEHYTTVYDMYLIFNAAVQDERFVELISTQNHTANFLNSAGETVVKDWTTTNKYLKGEETAPEGINVIGGKTGTTNDAGYCLVLYSKKGDEIPYISIVYKSDSRDNLYYEMTELLGEIMK